MRGRRQGSDGAPVAEEVAVAEEWETGWRVSGPSAGMTALLQRAAKGALWTMVLAGPALGAAALLLSSQPTAAPRPALSREVDVKPVDTSGPAGFAQMYVEAYLTVRQGEEQRLVPFFPAAADVDLRLPQKPETSKVERLAPARAAQVDSHTWSVTISARLRSGEELRYFQVPVASSRVAGQGGYVATTLPAEVAAPVLGTPRPLGYGRPFSARDADPATRTLRGFFDAYLAGGGQLDRYLSPGTRLSAVTPAPYTRVRVSQFAVAGTDGDGWGAATPADGARQQLLVDVEAETTTAKRWRPMTYALSLVARDGRWEVAALESAPRTGGREQGVQQ